MDNGLGLRISEALKPQQGNGKRGERSDCNRARGTRVIIFSIVNDVRSPELMVAKSNLMQVHMYCKDETGLLED
jgi:hypothetical protein